MQAVLRQTFCEIPYIVKAAFLKKRIDFFSKTRILHGTGYPSEALYQRLMAARQAQKPSFIGH
ncbi:MAG: hypothetical protein ACOYXC_13670 [Candidatus Rifleibacteriota bacterium]